ncbi:hypothetical protein D3C75_1080120 [compost metagenome]
MNSLRQQICTVIKPAEVPSFPRLLQFTLYGHPVSPLPSAGISDFRLNLERDLYSDEFSRNFFLAQLH